MNLSETAFLYPEGDGYRLHWFTPAVEVDLCGHTTLASAHILWETGVLPLTSQLVSTPAVVCSLAQSEATGLRWISLSRPPEPVTPPAGLLEALGLTMDAALFVGRNVDDYLVEVATEGEVHALTPDFGLLNTVSARGASSPAVRHHLTRTSSPVSSLPLPV